MTSWQDVRWSVIVIQIVQCLRSSPIYIWKISQKCWHYAHCTHIIYFINDCLFWYWSQSAIQLVDNSMFAYVFGKSYYFWNQFKEAPPFDVWCFIVIYEWLLTYWMSVCSTHENCTARSCHWETEREEKRERNWVQFTKTDSNFAF